MSEQFLGEIRLMSFNFPPKGWAQANGQTLPINQNQALFSLCGTTYGGNGTTTFALPDLRGRVPMAMGGGWNIGQATGEVTHTLVSSEMPAHTHFVGVTNNAADLPSPTPTAQLAQSSTDNCYTTAPSALQALNPAAVSSAGGSQPHPNMQPYLVLNFCIALVGIFPSRN